MTEQASTAFGRFVDEIEETCIAICLGLMTIITFANVIARYVFNANILWALELTSMLFAWLVLMGASYGVKKHIHIGVDVLLVRLEPMKRRLFALVAVAACLIFSVLVLYGSVDYWWPFITERAWLETDDLPMPAFLQFLADWVNEGEKWERVPRFIPYLALPIGFGLLTLRFLQIGWRIYKGELDMVIASHEAEVEEALEEAHVELPTEAKKEN